MERHPKVKQELIFQASQCSRKPWWEVWVLGLVLPARSWWDFLTHPEPSATKQRNSPGGCWRMPAPEYIGQPRELHDSEALRDRVPKTPRQPSRGHYAVFYCIHNPRTWQRPALLECDACYRQAGCWAQHRYEWLWLALPRKNFCASPLTQHRPLQRSTGNYTQVSSRSNSCHKAHLWLHKEGNVDANIPIWGTDTDCFMSCLWFTKMFLTIKKKQITAIKKVCAEQRVHLHQYFSSAQKCASADNFLIILIYHALAPVLEQPRCMKQIAFGRW